MQDSSYSALSTSGVPSAAIVDAPPSKAPGAGGSTAQELLEALRSFVFEFGDKTNSATVNKARAAIAKASGGQA